MVAMLSALTRDQLQLTLMELLDLVDDFVHHLAEHNAISERAVLRSMGIEPNGGALGPGRARSQRIAPH